MTMSGSAGLMRRPGQRQRATFLELFFDLVYVFALTRISQRLVEDFTSERRIVLSEAGQSLLLLLTIWLIWAFTAGITDVYNPERPEIQLLVVTSMFGSLVMGIALPEAFGERAALFATTYLAVRVSQGLFLVLALRGHEAQRRAVRPLFWSALSAGPWIVGAFFADGPARGVLWTLALAVDYTGATLGHPAPWLGRAPTSEWTFRGEHLAERYQQFFIIALGELILIVGGTFSGGRFDSGRTAAFVVAFTTMALLWRIYIYRAGELFASAIAAAPDPGRVARSASYAHLIMVTGIVAIAVGDELVIEHPTGHQDPAWILVIIGGPALFLVGRSVFEYAVFARVSRSRVIGLLVLAALAPVMVTVPPLSVAVAAAIVLAGVAVSDAARTRGRPPEPSSPFR
jgi:low temperature requirement protein LtrA